MSTDYPANSRAAKQQASAPKPAEKKVEKVVTGAVIQRKKSFGSKLRDTFIGDSRSVGQYIVSDVVVPAAKEVLHDVVNSYMDRMLGLDRGPVRRSRGVSRPHTGRVNYATNSSIRRDPREDDRDRRRSDPKRRSNDYEEIILETRVEAEEVIDRMRERLEEYGQVSVADLYDMCDVTSVFTDNKWGWDDLDAARARYTRDGYLLDLPRPIALD
jgi:hypothetical protein